MVSGKIERAGRPAQHHPTHPRAQGREWDGLTPPYATIIVDPPWPYEGKSPPFQGSKGRETFLPYSAMTLGEITALPVEGLAQPGAHLYLWTTSRYLWNAKAIAEAWGWQVSCPLVWCKESMGLGLGPAFTITTEFVLFCRHSVGGLIKAARLAAGLTNGQLEDRIRGQRTALSTRWEEGSSYPSPADWQALRELLPGLAHLPDLAQAPNRMDTTWWLWKRGPHSAKPPAFLDLVEQVSPGPYVELFARQPRLGWDSWGHGFEHLGESPHAG